MEQEAKGVTIRENPIEIDDEIIGEALPSDATAQAESALRQTREEQDSVAGINISESALKVSQDIEEISLTEFQDEEDVIAIPKSSVPEKSAINKDSGLGFVSTSGAKRKSAILDGFSQEEEQIVMRKHKSDTKSDIQNSAFPTDTLDLATVTLESTLSDRENLTAFAQNTDTLKKIMNSDSGSSTSLSFTEQHLKEELQRVKEELKKLRAALKKNDINIEEEESSKVELDTNEERSGVSGDGLAEGGESVAIEKEEHIEADELAEAEDIAATEELAEAEVLAPAEELAVTEEPAKAEDIAATEEFAATEESAEAEAPVAADELAETDEAALIEDIVATDEFPEAETPAEAKEPDHYLYGADDIDIDAIDLEEIHGLETVDLKTLETGAALDLIEIDDELDSELLEIGADDDSAIDNVDEHSLKQEDSELQAEESAHALKATAATISEQDEQMQSADPEQEAVALYSPEREQADRTGERESIAETATDERGSAIDEIFVEDTDMIEASRDKAEEIESGTLDKKHEQVRSSVTEKKHASREIAS